MVAITVIKTKSGEEYVVDKILQKYSGIVYKCGKRFIHERNVECVKQIDFEQLESLYKKGKSVGFIARNFDVKFSTIYDIVKRYGITRHSSKFDKDRFIEVIKKCKTVERISKETGYPRSVVKNLMRLLGYSYKC